MVSAYANAAATALRSLGLVAGVSALGAAVSPATAFAQGGSRLEEIVVTSSIIETPRRQIGAAVSAIDGGEIELRGYHSVAEVLRTQPGIGVTTSGGHGKTTSLRIRGEEAHRTLLLIDGVKAIDPSAVQAAPVFDSLLTTGDLERVEVLRGPQGFMYGADAGGVVNVMTRRGEAELQGRLGFEHGPFDTRRVEGSIGAGNEKGDYFVSVTDLDTAGFNAMTADTVLADRDGADNTTLHAKLGWNPADRLRLQVVARDIDAFAAYDSCFTPSFEPTHVCSVATEQTTYRLSADHDAERLANRFAYSEVDIVRDNFAEGQLAYGSRGKLARWEYSGSYRASGAHTIAYGLDFQDERMLGDERLERDQRGVYAEYQGAFADRLYVSAGARYDDNEDFGSHTSVRLSAAYVQDLRTGATVKYRASFGTGFRAPSLYEVSYNSGGSALPPAAGTVLREEQSRGYDVGVEYDGPSGLHVELTYFNQRLTDEIFFDLVGFSGYLQSLGTSGSKGVELAGRGNVGDRWQVYGNWTYNETTNTSNEQRLRRPRNLANVGVLYATLDGRLRVSANYRISNGSIDIGNVALDDYGVLDLSSSYRIADRIELYARLENAADRDYQELIGYRTAGRSLYGGVRLRF